MDDGELYTQKVEVLLEMQNKKLLGELEAIKGELQELREQVSSIKRLQASAPVAAPPPASSDPVEPAVEVPAQANPADKPIDRNNVAPGQVSIEKMFYFGKK